MNVLQLSHVLQMARMREREREELLDEVRVALRDFAARSIDLEPFQHGTFMDQLAYELVTLRLEHGDPIAAARRARRNKKIKAPVRARIYRRDGYTCQECRWRCPDDPEQRAKANRRGKFLTIDHVIPLAEGGPNHQSNMRTLCSACNPLKGKGLPGEELIASA